MVSEFVSPKGDVRLPTTEPTTIFEQTTTFEQPAQSEEPSLKNSVSGMEKKANRTHRLPKPKIQMSFDALDDIFAQTKQRMQQTDDYDE